MSLNNSIIWEQLYLLFLQQDLYVQRESLRYQFTLWNKEEKTAEEGE